MIQPALRILFLSVGTAALVSGCGLQNCGADGDGDNTNNSHMNRCTVAQKSSAGESDANGGSGGGSDNGVTSYTFETLPNASSAGGNGAAVDLTVYAAAAITLPIAHDGPAGGPPYYAAVTVALKRGQTVYVRLADPGQRGGTYSVRVGNSGRQGGASTGTAAHPDRYDTADGAKPSGGADDAYPWATPLVQAATQDHGFWPRGEADWLVFTAP